MFQNMGSGCCSLTKSCFFHSSNSPGFAVPPLSKYVMSSAPSDLDLVQYVADRLKKLKPSKKEVLLNSIGAMF
jgi:hypothetical protein